MKKNLSDELTLLTSKLMLCNSKREIIGLSNEFGQLIEKVIEQEKMGYTPERITQEKSVTATIKFTKSEVANMAQTFKKEFIANGLVARIIKRQSGKKTFLYEIRYRRNGYNISASSTDLNEAKKKFLHMTTQNEIVKYQVKKIKSGFNLLHEIFDEWLIYKQDTITPKALRERINNFNQLPETIKNTPISYIRTADISACLKNLSPRKQEDIRSLFNMIFSYSMASGIISHNPVALIPFKRAERQNRDSLSTKESIDFIKNVMQNEYEEIRQPLLLYYFFGIRPCEIDKDAHREENFFICRNRKRKNGKIEYKKIPINKQAERYIDWSKPLHAMVSHNTFSKRTKKLLKGKTAYNLRHTFSSVCQQFVRQEIVDIWIGDSPIRLIGKVYTHFPDEFMKDEMDKVIFPE